VPTPEQVLPPLLAKLRAQRTYAKTFDSYYDGTHRIEIVEREYAETFGVLPGEARTLALRPPDTNVAAIGVDALSERLQVEAFRELDRVEVGDGSAETEAEGAARRLFEECDLDVQHRVGHTESLIKSRSFLLATPGRAGKAVVSVEDATQVAVLYSSEPPYDVIAAVKTYADPWTGRGMGKLWVTPDAPLTSPAPLVERYDLDSVGGGGTLWTPDSARRGLISGWQLSEPERLPWDEIPVGEIAYRTRLLAEPRSYIEPIASLADSYALLMAYLVIAARYGAIPVRWLAGVPLPRDPKTGEVRPFGWDPRNPDLPPRRAGAQNALASEDPSAKFGQLEAGQLAGFIGAIESILASITAITRVPQHYYGRGASSGISGETLKTSEAGLDRRVDDVTTYATQPYRKIVSLAVSSDLGRAVRLAPRWRDTRTVIEAQNADAFQKYVSSGLDLQTALERISFPPELIRQALARKADEQSRAALLLEGVNAVTGAGGNTAELVDAGAEDAAGVDDLDDRGGLDADLSSAAAATRAA